MHGMMCSRIIKALNRSFFNLSLALLVAVHTSLHSSFTFNRSWQKVTEHASACNKHRDMHVHASDQARKSRHVC
jgi:CHASE3 domain sensor protein